jgi:hypothetical protein
MSAPMRSVALLLVSFVFTSFCRLTPGMAAATEPCDRTCPAGKSPCRCPPEDRRLQEVEQLQHEQERIRLDRAARYYAAERAAQDDQRRRETFKEESVAAMRRRVGRLSLALAGATGCLTALTLYLDKKSTDAGHRSFRPIGEGLGGFTVVTAALGVGFLISGRRSNNHDVSLQLAPDRMLASLGWRFP